VLGNSNTKINIWLNDTYPLFNKECKDTFGGAEVDMFTLAKKIAKEGRYETTFYVGDYGQKHTEMYDNIKVKKLKYFNLKKYTGIRHKFLRQLYMWKEIMMSDGDIHITETASELLGWLAIISKKIKGKKIIFRLAHDNDTHYENSRKISSKLYHLYKIGLLNSDALISQTEIQQKMLMDNTTLDSKIIKNGFFINEDIDINNKKYILWVARCEEWKRPEFLVKLAESLPGEKFVMIMPISNGADVGFQKKIKEMIKNVNNIQNIDFVAFHEINKFYEGAKLFVNTSEKEGFPNAFVQACLAKTPILSFNVNPDEFITKNDLGFFCNDDLKKAVDFIKQFDYKKIKHYGNNAFEYVKKNHNIDKIYYEYDEIIRKLVN
jgi:glycosyltransferase involved in cell wall biosynthesis